MPAEVFEDTSASGGVGAARGEVALAGDAVDAAEAEDAATGFLATSASCIHIIISHQIMTDVLEINNKWYCWIQLHHYTYYITLRVILFHPQANGFASLILQECNNLMSQKSISIC